MENSNVHLLVDDKNNFCIYDTNHGILCNGKYQPLEEYCFYLEDTTQKSYYAIQTVEGIHLLNVQEKTIYFYQKLANYLILYDIKDEYPKWCTNP